MVATAVGVVVVQSTMISMLNGASIGGINFLLAIGISALLALSYVLSFAELSLMLPRSGSVSAGVTAIPLLPSTALNRLSATGSDANSFAGKGTVQNSNDFSGTITATVVQVLANGHLIVSAEKQIGVNANVDVLRFSGQVDPQSIAPGNSVQSTAIANVRIEQRGRGQQAEAQSMGWLSRFFLNVLPI